MSRVPTAVEVGQGHTLALAYATGAPLLSVVERAVQPRPDALERMLALAREPGELGLVCALVTDPAGVPVGRFAPRGEQADLEAMIVAAQQRRLPVRRVAGGCVLVRRDVVDTHGLPDERLGRFAFAEWSQRALADAPGWLLPSARAVLVHDGPTPDLRALPAAVRAARRGRWGVSATLRALGEALPR